MKNFFKNWKTTLLGLLVAIGLPALKAATGIDVHIPGMDSTQTSVTLLGAGLLAAKDGDKTGL